MKKTILIASFLMVLLASLLFSGCTTMDVVNAAGNSVTPVTAQSFMEMPTATIIPSATIDFQATLDSVNADAESARQQAYAAQQAAIDSQNTAIAANVSIAQITAQADANLITIMQATQEAEQLKLQQAAMTLQSSWVTGTAESTILPVTQTAQAQKDALEAARFTATAEAPIIAQKMASAKWEDQLGWTSYAATWAMVFVAIVFVLVLIRFVATQGRKPQTAQENQYYEKPLEDLIPIPMAQKDSEPGTTQRAVIPCTWPRLEMLSNGVIQQGKTLAKNQWEGTIVHRSIDALREYFLLHEFAYELPGKRGELGILEKGNHFFMYCVENGEPPPPHVCEQLPSPTA